MAIDDSGKLRQFMWCGPLLNADGLEEWAPYPFAAADEGDGLVISHAPMLRDHVGSLLRTDSLARPDGAAVPDNGKPGAERQTVAGPTAGQCSITGTITHQEVLFDVGNADYLNVTTTVDEADRTDVASATNFMVIHEVRAWDDATNKGHVLTLSAIGGTDGQYQPRNLMLNPYLQSREQMESGAGASQTLTGRPDDAAVFDFQGTDGARVITTVSRSAFGGDETAEIDVTLTCQ